MRFGSPRDHHLRGARRPVGRGVPWPNARQCCLVHLLLNLCLGSCGPCADRPEERFHRMARLARRVARRGAFALLVPPSGHGHASCARPVRMSKWMAYLHRISGTALALFLPVHFWALGRGLELDAFLVW